MVAEVPETLAPTCELFVAGGYVQEAVLTDYVLERPARVEGYLIPVTIDDLAANGLLDQHPPTCWERSGETLTARKDDIEGLAVATDESIDAFILYSREGEILSLRSFIEDGGARLKQLLSRLDAGICRFRKVHPAEFSTEFMEMLGFRSVATHRLYAAKARSA